MLLAALHDPSAWAALATLTLLEVILGIDNVILLSILVGHLPPSQQGRARVLGLGFAALTRIALLLSVVALARLGAPLFHLGALAVSARTLILGGGGLLLLASSVLEIHRLLETRQRSRPAPVGRGRLVAVVAQVAVLDVLFSIDSVFTAVGIARPDQLPVMVAAIVLSVIAMLWLAAWIAAFIERHPTLRMLALAFLILIGMSLLAEAMGIAIPKGYLYFAMGFAVAVELANLRLRRRDR